MIKRLNSIDSAAAALAMMQIAYLSGICIWLLGGHILGVSLVVVGLTTNIYLTAWICVRLWSRPPSRDPNAGILVPLLNSLLRARLRRA